MGLGVGLCKKTVGDEEGALLAVVDEQGREKLLLSSRRVLGSIHYLLVTCQLKSSEELLPCSVLPVCTPNLPSLQPSAHQQDASASAHPSGAGFDPLPVPTEPAYAYELLQPPSAWPCLPTLPRV